MSEFIQRHIGPSKNEQDGRPRQWRWQSARKDFGQRQVDQEIDRDRAQIQWRGSKGD